jgi:hypothetical protein
VAKRVSPGLRSTPGGTISSMRSSTSSDSTTSAPASRSSSCSGVRGPMITDVTAGWARTNAVARWVIGRPASAAKVVSSPTASSFAWLPATDRSKACGAWATLCPCVGSDRPESHPALSGP